MPLVRARKTLSMSGWRFGSMTFRGASTLGLKSSGGRSFGRASQRRRRRSASLGSGGGSSGRDGGEPSRMDARSSGNGRSRSGGGGLGSSGGMGHGARGSVFHSHGRDGAGMVVAGVGSPVGGCTGATASSRMETVSGDSSLGTSSGLALSVIGRLADCRRSADCGRFVDAGVATAPFVRSRWLFSGCSRLREGDGCG